MSRFFASAADSDSESSEEELKEPVRRQVVTYSSDEEDVKRVVKPAKEKYYGEVKSIILQINNYKKINDYSSLLSGFEELMKSYSKVQNVLQGSESIPQFVIRCLAELQQFVVTCWDNVEGRKSLTKIGYKSLAALRQKVRKFNKNFEDEIEIFFKNSENFKSGEIIEDEDTEDDLNDKMDNKDVSCDSSQWGDSGSESESDGNDQCENMRERFLKKAASTEEEAKKNEKKEKKKMKELKKDERDEEGWETVKGGGSTPMDRAVLFPSNAEITVAAVNSKLKEILLSRNMKRTERRQRLQLIRELFEVAQERGLGTGLLVKLRIAEICTLFDYNISALEPMKPELWDQLLECFQKLAVVLAENETFVVDENVEEEDESLETAPFKVQGSLAILLERLGEEFVKGLKQCDPFKNEYAVKLRDERKITAIIDLILAFLEVHGQTAELCRVKLCKIEHMYYKFDREVFCAESEASALDVVDKLCKYVYVHDTTQRLRTRAILAHIYHLALHDKWTMARDLMLMSHLQATIQHADVRTQILFNRAMAQLGLCAFRHGLVTEAHNCLSDLITTGHMREVLGQGFTPMRNVERNHELEMRDRQYQVPFHMYINLDLLECSYLISSMLLDVPAMAAQELDARRRLISKTFYQLLRTSDRQSLLGPPETMREHIVAASRALRAAKWRECRDFIFNPKMNAKVWSMVQQPTPFKDALVRAIQKQALKSYIFAYAAPVYDSLYLPKLATMFEMSEMDVQSTLASMIVEGELQAALNVPTDTLVLQKAAGCTAMQALAYQLADKLSLLVETSERHLERPSRQMGQQSRQQRASHA